MTTLVLCVAMVTDIGGAGKGERGEEASTRNPISMPLDLFITFLKTASTCAVDINFRHRCQILYPNLIFRVCHCCKTYGKHRCSLVLQHITTTRVHWGTISINESAQLLPQEN